MAIRKRKPIRNPRDAGRPPVLYVHGAGNHLPREALKREWDFALFGRDMGEDTRMAYWSDVVDGSRRVQVEAKRGAEGDREQTREWSLDRLWAEAGVDEPSQEAQALARALLRAMGVDVDRATSGEAGNLILPAHLRKRNKRDFLDALMRDSLAYFTRPDMRRKIQQRLHALLAPNSQPMTIVAHSLGAAIALDVLASLATEKPAHLITVGAPLGIPELRERLACGSNVPGAVDAWHNFSDLLDPLTADLRIAEEFEILDPAQTIVDEVAASREIRSLAGFDPGSAAVYLAHPRVREAVHVASRLDPQARFLVARDVAAALSSSSRQSVLIEILEPDYEAVGESREEMEAFEKKERNPRAPHGELRGGTMADRIERVAKQLENIVGKEHLKEARIDRLRRFVAARLTPWELDKVAKEHRTLRIYAVWKSNSKRALVSRSARVIQADAARKSYCAFGDKITWAVLDTGVRRDHPHFEAQQTINAVWDCTNPGPPKPLGSDRDPQGHGTHVSGIIAGGLDGAAWPTQEMQGIAPRTKLVVYKVLDDQGRGEDAWIIKALDHIAEQNENSSEIVIHGLNLSLGGPYDATVYGCGFSPLCVELRRLWRAGMLVVVAAGNEGRLPVNTPDGVVDINSSMSIGDPANLEDCIAVGSVNADRPHLYGVSWFSSHGPTSDGRVKPDVVAPGERISSCNSNYKKKTDLNDLYRRDSGTSMAAPHVSGMLAAFLSVRREFRGRPDDVKQLLLRTCVDIERDQYHQGHGVPNLMRMLLEA